MQLESSHETHTKQVNGIQLIIYLYVHDYLLYITIHHHLIELQHQFDTNRP